MDLAQIAAVVGAGLAAGVVNAVVGSGTLITFPVLVSLGYPPVVATMSNAIGLVPGNASGVWGYRRELAGQRHLLVRLVPVSLGGAAIGAWLLVTLPPSTFRAVVPVLIGLALVLVVVQPRIQRAVARRVARHPGDDGERPDHAAPLGRAGAVGLAVCVGLAGVYGGYFAGAQGILLLGVLGLFVREAMQRVNAVKNVLVGVVNVVAATSYTLTAFDDIAWDVAAMVAGGSLVGGALGARYGRRLPPVALRVAVVVLGIVAIVRILAG